MTSTMPETDTTTTYALTVSRDDQWWMIRIPALDGVNGNIEGLTQARRLADVPREATDYICTVADVAPSTVVLDTQIKVGDVDLTARSESVEAARTAAAEATARLSELSTELAHDLAHEGVPLRDIGTALGVSYQRAHQLTAD